MEKFTLEKHVDLNYSNTTENDFHQTCIGQDRKIHVFLPHENKTFCGKDILKKHTSDRDILGHYWCYECSQ